MTLKAIIYSFLLVLIISTDLISSGYMLICEDHNVELSLDFNGEKESKEKTELDEGEYEFSFAGLSLNFQKDSFKSNMDDSPLHNSVAHHSIPSPPPDRN